MKCKKSGSSIEQSSFRKRGPVEAGSLHVKDEEDRYIPRSIERGPVDGLPSSALAVIILE